MFKICFPNAPKTLNCIFVNTIFSNKFNTMIYCLIFITKRVKVVVNTVIVQKNHCFFLYVLFNQWLQSLSLSRIYDPQNPKARIWYLSFIVFSLLSKFALVNFDSFSFSTKFNWGSSQIHRLDFSTEVKPVDQNSVGDKSVGKFFTDIHRNFEGK